MMNIREYFENLHNLTTNDEEFDNVLELENTVYEMEDEEFESYCRENGIDLTVRDERTGELVVTLWSWDMCGE